MLLPNRHASSASYRYGFQGQEKDDEIKGEGNSLNYKYRMHDPRVGRFFAVDPLDYKYPMLSPYQFGANTPIMSIELEGLEAANDPNPTQNGGGSDNWTGADGKDVTFTQEAIVITASKNSKSSTQTSGENFGERLRPSWDTTKPSWLLNGETNSWTSSYKGNLQDYNNEFGTNYSSNQQAFNDHLYAYSWLPTHLEHIAAIHDATSEAAEWVSYAIPMGPGANLIGRGIGRGLSWIGRNSIKRLSRFSKFMSAPTGKFYSVAFQVRLSAKSFPGVSRYMHFKEANVALNNMMVSHQAFKGSMGKLGIVIPKSSAGSIIGKSPSNWVWHHNVEKGVMELVPKMQHPNIPGGLFWKTMHPRGLGGYSIWGK